MSKRKREIQKRKKLTEDAVVGGSLQEQESAGDVQTTQDPVTGRSGPEGPGPAESPVDDSQIVSASGAATAKKKPAPQKKPADRQPGKVAAPDSWFGQNKENLLLGLLVLYVILLGLGTVGELFEIEWILNLPLFK